MRTILIVLAVVSACLGQDSPEKLIVSGHWKRARVLVERRLREAPDDANATFLLSQIRNAFGDQASPAGLAERAVALDPHVARYHRQLAEVQGVMAQHAGVFRQMLLVRPFRREIDAALALDPRDTQALRDLLEFYLLAPGIAGGDVSRAVATADRIGAVDACEGFLAKARIAEFRKDPAQQHLWLTRAVAAQPSSYKAQMAVAHFYVEPGRRQDAAAEAVARTAIAIDPGRVEAYSILAGVYAARENWSGLQATLASAAEAVPDDPSPYYHAAGRLLTSGRDPARAERYLRIYLAQEAEGNQPTHADAECQLQTALRMQGHKGRSN